MRNAQAQMKMTFMQSEGRVATQSSVPTPCPAEEWQEEGQAWAVHYDLPLTVLVKDANRLQGPASILCKWGAMKITKKVVHSPGLQAQPPRTPWPLLGC